MAESLKIPVSCQLLPELDAGGIEKSTVDITRALVKAGGKTIVISGGGRMLPDILRTGAQHVALPLSSRNPFVMLLNALKIARIIRKNHVRVLHVRSPRTAWSAMIARRLAPVKLLATVHSLDGDTPRETKKFRDFLAKCDQLIAASAFTADEIVARTGVSATSVATIPRGIDLRIFNPTAVNPHRLVDLAKKWRLPDGIPLIIAPSRLARRRGQSFLIDTLATLKDTPFTCLFLGDDAINQAYRAELEAMIVKYGFEGQVRFVGFCDDMPAAYLLADIVVTPAIQPEPFGHVAVEAQAMGRPIVAADHGGAPEIILADKTGFLFKPGDSDDLKRVLKRVLSMTIDERAAMARSSRAHVASYYTLDAMCARTLALYASLVT